MRAVSDHSTVVDEPATARPLQTTAPSLGPLPLVTGTRLQEFEVHAVIGQGGFGIVYLARDLSLQRMVAIKEYMPAQLAGRNADGSVRPITAGQSEVFELGRRSFINEARMLARFKHPGLLEVLRFWEQNGTAYMAMPFYDGATLTQYLKRHPGVATEEWLKRTLTPLVDALGHMHDESCFHRDVAPDNILVLKDGSAVLLDLGAARRVIADDVQAMTVMLKPGYAPIEQYSDDPRFRQGPWTDIYAMAAVFFFGVTGKPPPASASRVMRDSVSPLSEVRPTGFSEAFLRAIDQGLSLQPEDRPRSIAEFRAQLHASAPPATSPTAIRRPPSRTAPADTAPLAGAVSRAAGAASLQRGSEPDGDEAFRPPAGIGIWTYIAGAIAALAIALASGWYAARLPASIPAAAAPAQVRPAPDLTPGRTATQFPAQATAPAEIPATAAPPAVAAPALAAVETTPPASIPAEEPVPAETAVSPAPSAAPPPASPRPVARATATESTATPATGKGTVVLAIKPWAEVRVDGVLKGVSPPLKHLTLPAGPHIIELRNPASPPVKRHIEVKPNATASIHQQF